MMIMMMRMKTVRTTTMTMNDCQDKSSKLLIANTAPVATNCNLPVDYFRRPHVGHFVCRRDSAVRPSGVTRE